MVSDIAKQILSGDIKPGDRLANEHQLCEQYNVSRTVIRDALRVLAGKGLIVSRPRRGTLVSDIENWNFLDPELILWAQGLGEKTGFHAVLLEARTIIEPQVAALATMKAKSEDIKKLEAAYKIMCEVAGRDVHDIQKFNEADKAYHLALLDATHNIILKQFGTLIVAALGVSFVQSLERQKISQKSLQYHGEVVEAIRNKDPYAARRGIAGMSQILNRRLKVKTHKFD